MGRTPMFPKGRTQMNIITPSPIKSSLQTIAERQHRSVSQVVTIILRSYLQEHGELPEAKA